MWELHDRLEGHISVASCRAEIDSFSKHGQLVPALGRPLHGHADFDVELVFGARRLFVAKHLNVPLLVEIREMTDREAIVAIDVENRQRADVSPYERGLSFAQWLRAGHFNSQDDIARVLGISASKVSRLISLTRLPSVVLNAFESPVSICEVWGLDLLEALDDSGRRGPTIRVARELSGIVPRLPSKEVYRQLAAASQAKKTRRRTRDKVISDTHGRALFRVRQQTHSVAVLIRTEHLPGNLLAELSATIAQVLQRGMVQVTESTSVTRLDDHGVVGAIRASVEGCHESVGSG
jgi:ParB/RepB/Spo0J family partition protein